MAKSKRSGKLRFLTLLLSLLMVFSFGAVAVACATDDTSEDDSTTESRTDTQTFSNADFEFFTDSDGSYLIGSASNWSSSTVSNGSTSPSTSPKTGIVDTQSRSLPFDEASWAEYVADPENETFDWSGFYYAFKDYVYYDGLDEEDDADELEDAEYFTDIDNYYDVPGYDLFAAWLQTEDGKAALENAGFAEDDFSDSDKDDLLNEALAEKYIEFIRGVNPGTHWADETNADELDEENGTHVLMLHNYRTNDNGTAMRYASTSITLQAGTAASVSLWVKTYGLTYNNNTPITTNNRGAFIEIANSVGGTSQDPLTVRNINTQLQNPDGENNGWMEYTFYLRASSYASTTFTVNLGLGRQAPGTTQNVYEYVQGYAFFDDLTYNVFKASDWDAIVGGSYSADLNGDGEEETTAAVGSGQTRKFDSSTLDDSAIFNAQTATNNVFALDLDELTNASGTSVLTAVDISSAAPALTKDDKGNTVEYLAGGSALIGTNDAALSGKVTAEAITGTGSQYAKPVQDSFANFSSLPFGTGSILMLYSGKGAPYTAAVEDEGTFTVHKDETLMVSFWVKTSELQGGTGATVKLLDAENESTIGAVDTTTLATVDIKDDYNKTEDIFDGWQFCAFYVTTEEDELSFSLEFSFGQTPSSFADTAISSYVPGFAAFADLRTYRMTEEQAALAATGTYALSVTLSGDEYSGAPSFDSPATNDKSLETGIAAPANYTGVYGGSYHVGGTSQDADVNAQNSLASAGLLSKKHFASYKNDAQNSAWIGVLDDFFTSISSALTDSVWAEIFGDSEQPLLIAQTVRNSYGYIANSNSTISADAESLTQIVVRVKLSPGASAYVYLIDTAVPDEDETDAKLYADTLHHETGISYRYDEDGNLVNLDPDDEEYDRRDNILLYYQDNGLWAKTRSYTGSEYYANLANYETDEDGNKTDKNGNIVYYAHDGAFYRYYDEDTNLYEVAVKDFTEAGIDLTGAQLQGVSDKMLYQKVENTTDRVSGWIYIRFFIAAGDESKTYRLELWSGDRQAVNTDNTAAANFVIFDTVEYGEVEQETYVSSRLTALAKELGYTDAEALQEAYESDPAAFMNGIAKKQDGSDYTNSLATPSLVYYRYSLYDDADYASYDGSRTDAEDPYSGYDPASYENEVAYLQYAYAEKYGVTYYDTFVNFAANEVTVSAAADDDTTTDDDTDNSPDYNIWLLVSSILLAAALILTLLALLLRKLLSGMKRKSEEKASPAYSNKRSIYIRKLRREEAENEEAEDEDDEELFTDEELYNETEEDAESAEEDAPSEETPSEDAPDENAEGENGGDKTE